MDTPLNHSRFMKAVYKPSAQLLLFLTIYYPSIYSLSGHQNSDIFPLSRGLKIRSIQIECTFIRRGQKPPHTHNHIRALLFFWLFTIFLSTHFYFTETQLNYPSLVNLRPGSYESIYHSVQRWSSTLHWESRTYVSRTDQIYQNLFNNDV